MRRVGAAADALVLAKMAVAAAARDADRRRLTSHEAGRARRAVAMTCPCTRPQASWSMPRNFIDAGPAIEPFQMAAREVDAAKHRDQGARSVRGRKVAPLQPDGGRQRVEVPV